MITRFLYLWERVESSLWFVPASMSIAAAVLAVVVGELDSRLARTGVRVPLIYSGDRDGARILLSTVAGSMITVAGVTFSVTVVALSMASSQFGPRLLVNFMRDHGNQFVLGTFIATFLFCLMALGQGGRDPEAIPAVSATIGLILALASLAVLIYFIHHVSSSIRAERVIDVVARDLDRALERLFPQFLADRSGQDQAVGSEPDFGGSRAVEAPLDGYIQRLDEERLVSIARENDLVFRVLRRPGHFVVRGEPVLRMVVHAGAPSDEIPSSLHARIHRCFILGRERSQEEDPEYGIHQLVEIAVRALSPGVNDPYTALSCVDWLQAVLCKVGSRPIRPPHRLDSDGKPRVLVEPVTFEGMLAAAFDQIRQSATTSPVVSVRMLEALASIAGRVDEEQRRSAIRAQADMVFYGARLEGIQECDRQDVDAGYRTVLDALGSSP